MKKICGLALALFLYQSPVFAATYVLGVVPQQSPLKLYQSWSPIADYLSAATGHKIVFQTEKSITEFEQKLKAGAYDFAYMNPYHYVMAHQQQGYVAQLRADNSLRGIIVSTQNQLNPLRLKQEAFLFPSPNAFAATLLVKYELLKNFQIDLDTHSKLQYVNSHDSVYKGVARGIGEYGGGVERTFKNYQNVADKSKLHVVYRTQAYPSHPIAFKASMPLADQTQLSAAMLKIPESLLKNLSIHQLIPTDDAEYDIIRQMLNRLAAERP